MTDRLLTKSMHGKEIVEENATTGYRWYVAPVADLSVISSSLAPHPGSGVGGGGLRRFVLTATAPGNIQLRAKLWRDWEGDSSVIDRFEIAIRAS
jgi:inhibitor of cysteine peptidase